MRTPTEHIKTLQRRIDFLKSREHINSFDKAEVGSLEWALINLQPQRQWVGLTDEQAMDAYCETPPFGTYKEAFIAGIRFVEAAHGIKE